MKTLQRVFVLGLCRKSDKAARHSEHTSPLSLKVFDHILSLVRHMKPSPPSLSAVVFFWQMDFGRQMQPLPAPGLASNTWDLASASLTLGILSV